MHPADPPGAHADDDALFAELRSLCRTLAQGAGEIALAGRAEAIGAAELGNDTKSSATDIATEFDRAAEAHIVGILRERRPDDAIVGEEGTSDSGTSGFEWFIDPIDGTTNYVYDQPGWSNSVAVARNGEMVAAAVFVPPLNEMFSAALGGGATLDDRPISASGETELHLALVGTGFGYQPEMRRRQAEQIVEIIAQVRDIRRLGSAAFDLCMVACGRLDVYYELELNSWDAAAGELIAREAGAVTSDFDGDRARPEQIVASAPGVHAAFLAALRAGRPGD
ncbi:MAG: inositol monophosphatase family protein [Ilumatobacteraceae bacterium]